MSDGLGMLDQQRARRTRRIPASKNPPRNSPVVVPQLVAPGESEAPEPTPVERQAEQKPIKAPKQTAKPSIPEPTVKMSIYLEPTDDLYLEEIAHAGKISRPRVAISRSAIVRLALERLGDAMTIDEIVRELRRRGEQHQGAGRKRR